MCCLRFIVLEVKWIENPAACEIRSVIHFLNAKNIKPADIHQKICEVYRENATSNSVVRRWIRQFNEGREQVHDEEGSGRPFLVNKELVRAVEERVKENCRFTISDLSTKFC